MSNETESFKGKIKMVSSSPHGTPEGVVLDNGAFIKIPPHSILDEEKIKTGATISGNGELISTMPNQVFHHVVAKIGNTIVSDDQGTATETEALKKQHKKEIDRKVNNRVDYKDITLNGKVFSLGLKPNGEVDRMMLEDGTAVHIPRELLLDYKKVKLGDTLKIVGEGQTFKDLKFLKAKSIAPGNLGMPPKA